MVERNVVDATDSFMVRQGLKVTTWQYKRMAEKKLLPTQIEVLKRVRKALPPPSRIKGNDKTYHRAAARRDARKTVEHARQEE